MRTNSALGIVGDSIERLIGLLAYLMGDGSS